jgi:hypothetical protein
MVLSYCGRSSQGVIGTRREPLRYQPFCGRRDAKAAALGPFADAINSYVFGSKTTPSLSETAQTSWKTRAISS